MPAPKRPNYFQSQFLIVRDFKDEQTYHAEMLQLHNLTMHDWGVVRDGLQVTRSGNDYVISRGSAIDSLGREIVLDDPASGPPAGKVNQADVVAALAAAGAGQDVLITIAFREVDSTTDIDQYPPPGGSDNVTRKVQAPVIAVTKAPAPIEAVILASVKVDGKVDYSLRRLASGFVRVGDSNDLSLDPGRSVGIGTTTPGFPLSFSDALGDKIALWGQSASHYGFGIQSSLLQIFTDVIGSDVAFGYGSSGSFTETMRVKGNGNVDIPTGTLQIGTAPKSVTKIDSKITHIFGDETTPRYTIDRDLLGNGQAGLGFNMRKVPSATLAANGSAVGIPTDRTLAFSTSDGTSLVERMRIDGTGNVSITKDLKVTGALSVGNGINLNNKPLTLRADNNLPDINHGLGYFGEGATTMGDFAMDGPVLYGSHSGALGTYGTKKVALRWDDSGNVGIGTQDPSARLTVKAGAITFTPSVGGLASGSDLFVSSVNTLPWVPSINVGDEVIIMNESRRVVAVPSANKIQVDRAFPQTFPKPQMTVIRDADILRMDDRAGNPKFCIPANGNVGIGTTDPQAKLLVQQGRGEMSAVEARRMLNEDKLGLQVHLDFSTAKDGNVKDLSANNKDGTLIGTQLVTEPNFGDCRSFNGTSDYLTVPDLGDYSNGLTIEAWVNFAEFSAWSRVIDFGNGERADNIILAVTSSAGLTLQVYSGSSPQAITAANVLQLNAWVHVAATINNTGTGTLYVNGQAVPVTGQMQRPLNVARRNNYIGKSNWATDPYFHGKMANLRIYNRVLTLAEIGVDFADDANTVAVTADLISKHSAGKAVFVSGKMGSGRKFDGGFEVRHSTLRQGIGVGYNTIYATGYRGRQDLTIKAKGNVNLNPDSGNVGIGTADPQATLQIGTPESVGDPSLRIGWGANNEADKLTIYSSDTYKMGLRRGSRDLKIFAKSEGTDAHIYLMPNDTIAMSLLSNGNVGIGTTNPTRGKVEVVGRQTPNFGTSVGFLQASPVESRIGPIAFSLPVGTTVDPGPVVSLYAENDIAAARCLAFSDERIKHNQGRSDSAADLRTLLGIEITDYLYKDVIGKGQGAYKKVIGQQVEKVFPQAVSKQTDLVPDIYQQASFTDGWIELATDLKKGERVKLITETGEGVHEVIEVTPDKFRSDFKSEGDKVFVFGREVNDFRNVDYDAIAMLNVSATQQLKKEKDEEVNALLNRITELQATNDTLISRLQILEGKMATAWSVVAAKNGSNGNGSH